MKSTKWRRQPADISTLITGLREVLRAANDDWHEATSLWSVCNELDQLLEFAAIAAMPDHPFKDEWSFQRRMSRGNSMAGQPIAPDQPCFTCEVPFAEHAIPATPDVELDVERLARAMHLARRLPEMDEPYCDNPLTEMDLSVHMDTAKAIIHAYAMLPLEPNEAEPKETPE